MTKDVAIELAKRSREAFTPLDRLTVAEYAERSRYLANEGGGYVGRFRHDLAPYIWEPEEELTSLDYLTVCIVGPGQSTKALSIHERIPTPSGWITMEDIKVGQIVFDECGRQTKVTGTSPITIGRPCYRLRFSDGAEIVADADHLWQVEYKIKRCKIWRDHTSVLRTQDMVENVSRLRKFENRTIIRNTFSIPVAGPLQVAEAELPIDPYVLGVWLGDGNTTGAGLYLHSDDAEILDYIEAAGYIVDRRDHRDGGLIRAIIRTGRESHPWLCRRGHDTRIAGRYAWGQCKVCGRQDSRHRQYGTSRDEPRPLDSFSYRLSKLELLGNKHIPLAYLRASKEQRLALFQGLMDTDGTIDSNKSRASFCTTLPRLSADIAELMASLGIKSTARLRKSYAVVGDERRPGADHWDFSFTALADFPIFRLKRKLVRQHPITDKNRLKQLRRRKIIAIEPIPSVPVRCIAVDSPSHLYLAGDAMIPTHNSTAAENWLLRSVARDPADMLWYMQTDPGLESYVKSRINPMIDQHDELRLNQGLRPVDDSLHFKKFRGMTVEFLSATHANLINKRAPRIVADEVDAYDPALGDVKALLDVRRQTFGQESMLLAISHPDLATGLRPDRDWTRGIMAIYADSDRRVWYWPCPHCGAWSSPCPTAARVMTLDYPLEGTLDEIQEAARLVCPVNGCAIEDSFRREMNRRGVWIGDGQEIAEDGTISGERKKRQTAGFWITGLMSLMVIGGIGGLARARVKAEREREVSGDDETLKQVFVKQWGVPYQPPRAIGSIDANTLADRAAGETYPLGLVPEGVRFLTAVSDQQLSHFELLVVGWGVRGEAWIVDHERIPGDPATSAEDWDQLIAKVLERTWPIEDGSGRRMAIRAFGYDSGGAPGVTQQAYAAYLRWRRKGLVRLYGKISGRDAWNVLPTQGAAGVNATRLSVVYPDTVRAASKVAHGGVPVARFNANAYKDDLNGQLQRGEPGPWYVHFPKELRSREPPHVWFEQLCAERRLITGRWEKINPSARNEALDLMVLARVIADLHGLRRIVWEKPPAWAKPWDENSFVGVAKAKPMTMQAKPGQSRIDRLAH